MSCDSNIININHGDEPPMYLWPDQNCSGTPLKLTDNSIYIESGVSVAFDDAGNQLPYKPQTINWTAAYDMIDTSSIYIPPHMEAEYVDRDEFQINYEYSDYEKTHNYNITDNQGTIKYDNSDKGFFKNLHQQIFGVPYGNQIPRPIDDSHCQVKGTNVYSYCNRIRSLRLRHTAVWDKFKINCCRGITSDYTDQDKCSVFWGPTNDGVCDNIMKDWATWNPTHPDASCIVSEIANPQCFDLTCFGTPTAYLTKTQRDIKNKGCPETLKCNQILNLSDGAKNNLINGFTQIQKCTVTNAPSSPDSTATKPVGTIQDIVVKPGDAWPEGIPPPNDPRWSVVKTNIDPQSSQNQQKIIVIIVIIIAILYLASSISLISDDDGDDDNDDESNNPNIYYNTYPQVQYY
jgi:hypothetical protein